MATVEVRCFECGTIASFTDRVGIREECQKCRADLHVCRTCKFYDKSVYNECRETQADVILEKTRANRCDYYQPSVGGDQGAKKEDLLSAAEALFKKK